MRIAALLILLAIAACAPPPRMATYAPRGIGGDVTGPHEAKGRLIIGWMTPAEAKESVNLTLVRNMIERWVVTSDDVDFGVTPKVPYYVPNVPPDTVPFVILDTQHDFWPTLVGKGHGMVGQGKEGGGDVTVKPNPPSKETRCEGPRYRSIVIEQTDDGPTDPDSRSFCAFLPKTFQEDRTYPVIYLFPGLMSDEMAYVGPNGLGAKLDEMNGDAVLVAVDTSTRYGSSYLVDLEEEPFDSFMSSKAMEQIETAVHGRKRRSSRAVLGQSTGGYNALSFGMRHSDLISVIGASSPDPPDFEKWMFEPGTHTAKPWIHAWARLEHLVGGPGQFPSWAHAWSKDAIPFNLENGRSRDDVLSKWTTASPHGMLKDKMRVESLRADLSGNVAIIVGKKDDFGLFEPANAFADELNAAGISTSFVATEDGHANGLARLTVLLRFALERLD